MTNRTGGTGQTVIHGMVMGEPYPFMIDNASGLPVWLDAEHAEVHRGSHYFVKTWVDIDGAGTQKRFMFITPPAPPYIHARVKIDAEAEFTVEIYEGCNPSTDGTPVTSINNDRNSTNVAELKTFVDPSTDTGGTLIWATKVGTGKNATGVAPQLGYEILAKEDTKYTFVITKEAANIAWIDVDFWWYERDENIVA